MEKQRRKSITAGPEFGVDLHGKNLIIDKSLYGFKTSAARLYEHLSESLLRLEFKKTKHDPDLWMGFYSWKFFFCSIFRDITFLTSLRFLQYHGSRFCATYHSSSTRQNILSSSYRRNNKVQIEQKSFRGFRRID
jgi:hypothetical protein